MKQKFLVVVSLSCLVVVAPCSAKQRHATAKQSAKQEQPAAQAVPALPPPTLAQMPASPPQVSFQAGQLTIAAQNSTLGDILKAVRVQTGATVDFPGNASERVVGNFGPAPARDVLTSLLNGSHFNYLLLGSPTDPTALDRVILMAKSSGSVESNVEPASAMEQPSVNNQNVYARPMPAPPPAPGSNTVTVEGQDAQDDAADDSADATDDTDADDQTDQTDQTGDQQAVDTQQQQQDGQQNVKTPEQILQQLQQRQQQLQQQGIQPGQAGFPNPGLPGQQGIPGATPHN